MSIQLVGDPEADDAEENSGNHIGDVVLLGELSGDRDERRAFIGLEPCCPPCRQAAIAPLRDQSVNSTISAPASRNTRAKISLGTPHRSAPRTTTRGRSFSP